MDTKTKFAEIRLGLGCFSLVAGFLAANLALFQWVDRTGLSYLLGNYARYVCAYGGFSGMIFGALLINDFLLLRKAMKRVVVGKRGLSVYCNVGNGEKQTVTPKRRKSEGRKIAVASLAFFLFMVPIVHSLVTYMATVVVVPISHAHAFISYSSNTGVNLLNSAKERTWNGTLWSAPEAEMPSAGASVRWVRAAYCPISSRAYEKMVVTLSSDAYLDAFVWNGSSWVVTNNIGQVNSAASGYQSFDIAFETSSGRAMLVYAILSSDASRDLAYRIWNGTAWSNEAYIDDAGHGTQANYRWVEVESNPNSSLNELALIAIDQSNADCNGWIWNGSVWGHFQELENGLAAVRDNKLMGLAYEQSSGQAMFIWGYSGYMESRKFNGTSWENELPAISITATSNVRWISLKPDPVSNQLMVVIIDSGDDLNSVFWNGTLWGSPVEHDDGVTHPGSRCADFDWEPTGSKGLLVWSTAQDSVSYKTFTAPSTWGSSSTASNPAGHPWIQLRRSSRNADVKILGATLNGNQDLFGLKWDGATLTLETTAFTTDTGTVAYECFDIAFQLSGY